MASPRKPSLNVSPPENTVAKDKGWMSRTFKRSDSRPRQSSKLSSTHGRTDAPENDDNGNRHESRASLGSSDYDGEYEPTDAPAASHLAPPTPAVPPPRIPTRHPARSQRDSTASSAFLSVSPARAPSNTSATLPLTSLYLVSGLPKSPQTWTLADQDSTAGVHHSDGAVGRFWRAEVLGSSVTPGIGKRKRRGKGVGDDGGSKRVGTLHKNELGKMLSKALKLSFTREVEIIASTLQPVSTVHTFTFGLPTGPDGPSSSSNGILRASMLSTTTNGDRAASANYPYADPSYPRPSSTYLGPPAASFDANAAPEASQTVPYYGVCLTVWSHADEERTAAIRRTLEIAARNRPSTVGRINKPSTTSMDTVEGVRKLRQKKSVPWSATEGEESDPEEISDGEPGIARNQQGLGASTLFLPPNTVFWLPYALTLVSRHPIYDLMRDYLTLSWARFSKDVQSHTLQISKILEYPAPRPGEQVKIDAGVSGESMEVVCRFPGGLDFGRGLVDVNFTMWPLFQCLNMDNILTICELALAPTGRVLFLSRHPAILGIAVSTIKYLVELRGWNGISLPIVHARDAKIYLEDPGPWIMGIPTETRYIARIQPEVCICDLDINFVNCATPPGGVVSTKSQRDKFRKILMAAFDSYYHPDHSIPSEFKEAFPAGRFRPLCKILTKKGSTSTAVAESIRAPEWWHQTKVVQAFDSVLRDRYKKPTLLKRLAMMGMVKRPATLSSAEQLIQLSIRKRASAFVDARDDLETKIGRLSRRLNFLLTESELWRQKFVTFEEYAESLAQEAAELRTKVGKEQRESKRLSGLVSITAHEKEQLKSKLNNTEIAHREAIIELERMKDEMDEMERERSQMIAEVEQQIERALVSMAFSDNMSDAGLSEGGSRPGSAMSSRPSSRAGSVAGQLRSFGTATTLTDDVLVDSHPVNDSSNLTIGPMGTVKEVDENDALEQESASGTLSEKALRRFSATRRDSHLDGMNAIDHGISERSDAVAQKMLQIQQKLEAARLETRAKRARTDSINSNPITEDSASIHSRARQIRSKAAPINPIQSKPPLVSHQPDTYAASTFSAGSFAANVTPKARSGPQMPPPAPPSAYTTGVSSTDDSDDYQSAVDVSAQGSENENEEPNTPLAARWSTSRGIDVTARDSYERVGPRIMSKNPTRKQPSLSSIATSTVTLRS